MLSLLCLKLGKTLPQFKMTPVKWVAQQFIRKGAAIGNYLWLDSQDIGGIDKTPLRQCDNWLMGRMKEAHEVERILKQLLGMKVKAEEIQTLPLGHFYAVIGNEVKKVYVLPAGVPEDIGRKVSRGELTSEYVRDQFLKRKMGVEDVMWKEKYEDLLRKYDELERKIGEMLAEAGKPREHEKKLEEEIRKLKNDNANLKKAYDITVEQLREACDKLERFRNFENALIGIVEAARPQGFESATSMPSEINVQREAPALTVQIIRKPLVLSTDNAQGRLALLYAEGFF
jgi:hypothetical protein